MTTDLNLRERVKNVEIRLGRPLRVLHIGNIANNAYINSKLLNELGVESHVLCHDYYHVMGTPEWEDAFFDSTKIDHFFPDWKKIDLAGFQRPRWFAQGPLEICLQYLLALQKPDRSESEYLFRKLSTFNRTSVPTSLRILANQFIRRVRDQRQLLIAICGETSIKEAFVLRFPNLKNYVSSYDVMRILLQLPFFAFAFALKRSGVAKLILSRFPPAPGPEPMSVESQTQQVLEFRSAFPTRTDLLTMGDFEASNSLNHHRRNLSLVLSYYDVIHAYATGPILPMICGLRNYVAYEHGTIRTYIYTDAPIPRLAALAYHEAPVILSTNADCLPSALRLKNKNATVIRGLHGFDERQVLRRFEFADQSRTRKEARFNVPDDVCLFLHPARQDWSIKGNDRLLEAIRLLKSQKNELQRPFVVVMAEWGNDVSRSKEFIERFNLDDDVMWIDILSKSNLIHSVAHVEAVIDQFLIPCIGAVPPELLTVATGPVITYLDDSIMSEFYGRTLPVLKASTPEQIAEQMLKVINRDPAAKRSLEDSKKWVREIHSHQQVVAKCLDAYDQILISTSSDGQK